MGKCCVAQTPIDIWCVQLAAAMLRIAMVEWIATVVMPLPKAQHNPACRLWEA
jgi:hypothetical protein